MIVDLFIKPVKVAGLDRVTENAEIYWSRAFRLVNFHEISAVFDGRKRPTPYSRSACRELIPIPPRETSVFFVERNIVSLYALGGTGFVPFRLRDEDTRFRYYLINNNVKSAEFCLLPYVLVKSWHRFGTR